MSLGGESVASTPGSCGLGGELVVGWGEGVGCVVAMDGVGQGNVTACNKNDEIRVEQRKLSKWVRLKYIATCSVHDRQRSNIRDPEHCPFMGSLDQAF